MAVAEPATGMQPTRGLRVVETPRHENGLYSGETAPDKGVGSAGPSRSGAGVW